MNVSWNRNNTSNHMTEYFKQLREICMTDIAEKIAVVVGCTGGVGRSITHSLVSNNASVHGIAQDKNRLQALQDTHPSISIRSLDATDVSASEQLITEINPDILVIALGAVPHMVPISEQSWESFSRPWDIDMKASFNLCKSAINTPLKPGSTVILISGGPGLGASPLSGSLSPAKNGQLFLSEACQWQSNREELDIRFVAIAPKRVMPNTAMGKVASRGYAEYLGITVEAFMDGQSDAQNETDVGPAVISIIKEPENYDGSKYVLTNEGLGKI